MEFSEITNRFLSPKPNGKLPALYREHFISSLESRFMDDLSFIRVGKGWRFRQK
jgi:hypothetical protein